MVISGGRRGRHEKEKHLQRRPKNLETMPKIGILSQRAKNRPNPIGVTVVEIVNVENEYIEVKGLDAINETPILDIKPYYPHYDKIDNPEIPEWVNRLMKKYF
ncbi:MAG: TrmO family methyltransferase [Candidatus Theseobacter exili]|nr:TrmO family methyltransferase [Candidatus Theseobacter exili]